MSGPTSPHADGGANPAAASTTPCPERCPTDFAIEAPCRIIKADGGSVQISASEMPGYPAGTYEWTTTSTKIRLSRANTSTVTVTARANHSSGRDAEIITVTRTACGCGPIVKTVNVTVAKVSFSKSSNQRYGYDDYDTPRNTQDNHICVKSGGNTLLQVDINGGATSADFNFVCEDGRIDAEFPAASASFELRLRANLSIAKLNTRLHARCQCSDATSFSSIKVHVYREKRVEVVVAKIGTNLRFPGADYAAHQNAANDKLKEAVVMYRMYNYNADNSILRVHYDLDGNRAFTYDIANNGGRELDAIRRAMTGTRRRIRVAIVRNMVSYYYLSAPVNATDTSVTVMAGSVFDMAGDSVKLGTGATQEQVTVTSVSGNTVNLVRGTPAHPHATGDPLEFPAAGWSSDPIMVIEGDTDLDEIKWTIIHEVGHRALNFQDVDDTHNIMHFQQGATDHRLRYCPRARHYNPPGGRENQWETIPR